MLRAGPGILPVRASINIFAHRCTYSEAWPNQTQQHLQQFVDQRTLQASSSAQQRHQTQPMPASYTLPSMPVAHASPSQYAMPSHRGWDSLQSVPVAHATPSHYAMDSHQPISVQPNPASYLSMAGAAAPQFLQSLSFFNAPISSPVPHVGASQPPPSAYQVQEIPQRYTGRTVSDKSFSQAYTTPAPPRRKHSDTGKKNEAAMVGTGRISKKKAVVRKSASSANLEALTHVSLERIQNEARRLIVYRCIFEGRIFDNHDDGCDIASDAVRQIRNNYKKTPHVKTVARADLNTEGLYKVIHFAVLTTQLTPVTALSYLDYEAG
jgi:hypothetical protein